MNLLRRFPAESLAPVWGVFAYFVTFFLVGVWHGRTSAFLFFGVLQGLGVSMNKLYEIVLTRRLGRKRAKALAANPVYSAVCRGLTFTWFAFTLIWFWSNWSQIGALASAMGGAPVIAGALGFILVCASVGLALWEVGRHLLLDMDLGNAVLHSRYTRTAWCTALGLVALIIGMLMSQSTPEIVYKAF